MGSGVKFTMPRARRASLALTVMGALMASGAAAQTQTGLVAAQPAALGGVVVRDIIVEGNQRIESATVLSYLPIAVGGRADAAMINEGVKRLYDTRLFRDVRIEPRGDVLVVRVQENPIINQIAFEGNRRLDDDILGGEVQSAPRRVFTRAMAESDAQTILDAYRRSGRYGATVEPKIIQLDQNRVNLVFEIDEGALTEVQSVRFVGNQSYSDNRLRRVISTDEAAWWRFFSTTTSYDPDRVEFDRELLRRYYLDRGFADVEITAATAEIAPDRSGFFLTFTIDEGAQYRFGAVDVVPNAPGVPIDGLSDVIMTRPGDFYDLSAVEETISEMSFRLGEQGYAFTRVEPDVSINRETRTIDIVYAVNEGPKIYVERIDIEGNSRTLDRVIRREFELVEGDAFNAVQVQRSRSNIRGLGFFSRVDLRAEDGSAPDRVVIKTEVEEASTGQLSFGLGFSSSENISGEVSLVERNLLGRGQYLRLRGRVSGERQIAELSFTEPYFLGRDLAAGFDAFYTVVENQDSSSFDTKSIGLRPRLSFPLDRYTRVSPRYLISSDEVTNVPDDASPIIQRDEGTEITSALGYGLVYDRRDDPVEPRKGYIVQLDQDFAGLGGDAQYINTQISAKGYQELFFEDVVGSVELSGGAIIGISDNIRTTNRYFLGGDSFRGFQYGGLGPRDELTDDALGGNYYAKASVDVTFPLGLPEEFGVYGGVFSDVGTLFHLDNPSYVSNGNQVTIDDGAELRASVGASLFWDSPIGPIRLNLAAPILKEDGDEEEIFRFTAGTRF